MPVTFACEMCHAEYTVDDALAGKKGRCNSCGHVMQVPGVRRASPSDSTLNGRSSSSTAGGRHIGFADPLGSESRDIPARNAVPSGAPDSPDADGPLGPLGDLDDLADDGTIPFTEEFQPRGAISLNIGGAVSYVSILLGIVLCLLPLLNQPAINAWGRVPVYCGLALGLLGAFLMVQKGQGGAGVIAGALTVSAFFAGALHRPATPSDGLVTGPPARTMQQKPSASAVPAPVPLAPDARAAFTNLNSFDPAARLAAAQRLVKDPPKGRLDEVARALEPKLSADDPRMRLVAIQGVMLAPTDHTAIMLDHLVHDPDRAVRESALRAQGRLGGPNAIRAIVSRLADDPAIAREALAAAQRSNPAAATEAFRELLSNSTDPRLRAIAIDELANRRATDLADTLTALIADPDPRVRDAAILALGKLKVTSAIRAISEKLGETDAAVTALQAFGPAAEKDALMVAASPNKLIRAAAARVLITAATPQNLHVVQQLAEDDDRAVVAAALEAWKRLVPEDFTPLQEAARDLSSSDPLRQRKALDRLATDLKPDGNASQVAMRIATVSLGDQADLRAPAAKALKAWGSRDALLVLVNALNDPQIIRRERAKEMLGLLKDYRAVDPVTNLADQGNITAVEALAAMGPMAEDGALRLLDCHDASIRSAAVRALGAIGTGRSVLPLASIMRTQPNEAARAEYRDAIRKINLRVTAKPDAK